MDSEFKIKKKYVKFSLAANIIFNNSIFAGCNKKGNKGYSGKGDKSTETNTTPNKETSKKPEKQNNDYKEKVNELLELLNNIEKNNELLTDKIAFSKLELENQIKNIDSDEIVKNIENELNNLKSKIEEAKKKKKDEEKNEDEEKKKEEEKERKKLIKSFEDGYGIDNTCKLTIKLEDKKFKLYFKETTLIAESETEINEKDIKKADDYTKYTYTIILSFNDRHTHYIKSLAIDDIIKNIKDCKKKLDTCCKGLDHCYIKIDIYFDEEKYDDSYYDINTGQLFYYDYCSSDSSLKDENMCIVPISSINEGTYKFTVDKEGRAYYNEKYGKLVKKDNKKYFKADNKITNINDKISKETITKFSKIILHKK